MIPGSGLRLTPLLLGLLLAAVLTASVGAQAVPVGPVSPVGPDGPVPTTGPSPTDQPELAAALSAVTGGPTSPSPLPEGDEVSLALRDLWLARGELTDPERRVSRGLLARPTAAAAHSAFRYPTGVVPQQRCNEQICVTHVDSSRHAATEQWAEQTLRMVETSWRRIVDTLGYRAPPPDGESGGDQRFDVYLADLSAQGYYGFCAPDAMLPGQRARATSYCVLDNDMAGFGSAPLSSLAATAAHELFHAVQYNYDVAEDRWFMEASATWVEEQVFDDVDDNRQFLTVGQLGDPLTPLDSTRAMYGNWIFVQWLSQRYGAPAVRQVWERLDASVGAPDAWSLQGVRRLVTARGGSWPAFYAGFARANHLPARHYAEGSAYRAASPHDRVRLRARPRTRTVGLAHLSSRTIQATWRRGTARRKVAVVRVESSRRAQTRVQVLVVRPDGRATSRTVRLGKKGRGQVRVADAARIRRLVVLISHTGTNYRRCGRNSGWACGGQPPGDLEATVKLRLSPRR